MAKFVAGEGPVPCDLMLVGEAPGAMEDRFGRPFVGKSGELLDGYLWKYCKRARGSVYVTNVYKFRPPQNRTPTKAEIHEHETYLAEELATVRPSTIVTLGATAASWFLGPDSMEHRHGFAFPWGQGGQYVFVVYHPAAALHAPQTMTLLVDDFRRLAQWLKGDTAMLAPVDGYPKPRYEELI